MPAPDVNQFNPSSRGLTAPATKAFVVTPSDDDELTVVPREIYIGTAGDVAVIMAGDTAAVTLKNLANGARLPYSVRKVMATNTTASNIVGVY